MESKIIYNGNECELTDDFIDIGYMAENIEISTLEGKTKEIKRSDEKGSMTLFVSFPHIEPSFLKEMLKIDTFLNDIQVDIHCYFIFNTEYEVLKDINEKLNKFEIVVDSEEEFGNMYGTKIVSGTLEDQLTKALFLISKDGAVFYLEMPKVLDIEFDIERLRAELNRAYVTYTGVGCHG